MCEFWSAYTRAFFHSRDRPQIKKREEAAENEDELASYSSECRDFQLYVRWIMVARKNYLVTMVE